MSDIRILVSGAFGRMGREVVSAVVQEDDMTLVGAVDPAGVGHQLSEIVDIEDDIQISGHLAGTIEETSPDVMIDFTLPAVVLDNIEAALTREVACVVGTTGLSETDLKVAGRMCDTYDTACFIAPNFSIGANLMMKFAQQAADSFDCAEIVERHHENKADAPSGTALRTAQMMTEARGEDFEAIETEVEDVPGSRGADVGNIKIHAMRLPGYVAEQEVVFGGRGERLVINHVSVSRECFMPGVLLATRQVQGLDGLVVGLEQLL